MAAGKSLPFTADEWTRICKTLADDPTPFGLPQRVYGSVVLDSFNIRKLGRLQTGSAHARDSNVMAFLADASGARTQEPAP